MSGSMSSSSMGARDAPSRGSKVRLRPIGWLAQRRRSEGSTPSGRSPGAMLRMPRSPHMAAAPAAGDAGVAAEDANAA